jgi:hypothetical protein
VRCDHRTIEAALAFMGRDRNVPPSPAPRLDDILDPAEGDCIIARRDRDFINMRKLGCGIHAGADFPKALRPG